VFVLVECMNKEVEELTLLLPVFDIVGCRR
jgi:hypothetical protein